MAKTLHNNQLNKGLIFSVVKLNTHASKTDV